MLLRPKVIFNIVFYTFSIPFTALLLSSLIAMLFDLTEHGLYFLLQDRLTLLTFFYSMIMIGVHILLWCYLDEVPSPTIRESIYGIVISWAIVILLTSIVFKMISGIPFIDSLFEVTSGFTGTGLTVLYNIEYRHVLVKVIRMVMEVYGGIGIVIIAVMFLSRRGSPLYALYIGERGEEKFEASVRHTLSLTLKIYLLYIAIISIMFILVGVNIVDAIYHAATGVATGGFSTYDENLGGVLKRHPSSAALVLIIAILAMILGAINFKDHVRFFRSGNIRYLFSYETTTLLTFILIIVVLGIIGLPDSIMTWIFHVVSAITTTGFQIVDIRSWDDYHKLLLALAMCLGGCVCSTAGGVKILRWILLAKILEIFMREKLYPRGYVFKKSVVGITVDERRRFDVIMYIAIYFLTLIVGALIVCAHGYRLADSVFEVSSALANAGLSVGIASHTAPVTVKLTLIVIMFLGRLEILPIIVLILDSIVSSVRRLKLYVRARSMGT